MSWFCSIKGNEFFCEVEEEYLLDNFNLAGLKEEVELYDEALDTILDAEGEVHEDERQEAVDAAAEMLYGLIHARFIITAKGLQLMVRCARRALRAWRKRAAAVPRQRAHPSHFSPRPPASPPPSPRRMKSMATWTLGAAMACAARASPCCPWACTTRRARATCACSARAAAPCSTRAPSGTLVRGVVVFAVETAPLPALSRTPAHCLTHARAPHPPPLDAHRH